MRDQDEEGKKLDTQDSRDGSSDNWRKQENPFSEFDDDSDFEESDRDSDFNAIYTEAEDEELEPDDSDDWSLAEEGERDQEIGEEIDEREDITPQTSSYWDDTEAADDYADVEQDLWDMDVNPEGSFDDDPPDEELAPMPAVTSYNDETQDRTREWEELDEEEDYEEEETRELNISMGMIIVAIFALVLLGAGGYGIVEERASLQEEIRQLQARLATSAAPDEVAASREATAETSERNAILQQQVAELGRENRSLQAIISGLESQLTVQQEALEQAPTAKPEPGPAPKVTPRPAEKEAAAPAKPAPAAAVSSTSGDWFVNFSSYGQRSTAQSWAGKLQPELGRVIVTTAESNGKNIYRVRVVDIPDKESAQTVAGKLQSQFMTGKLWVGRSE